MPVITGRAWIAIAVVLWGAGVGCAGRAPASAGPPAVAARDTHEGLQAVLWMQTSAEYQALCSAAYRQAAGSLAEALTDPQWSAVPGAGDDRGLPPAIILDLDETVLDNSPLQGQLVLDRTPYLPATWQAWVARAEAGLLPGAEEFFEVAGARGVEVYFVTNRTAAEEASTIANLQKLGITATADHVLCSGESGWTSDKTARRAEVARRHRVLLLVGDDLNDFVSTSGTTPAERMALARRFSTRWGRDWILLPNPVYGSWDRALYPGVPDDDEVLQRKREAVRGFR